MLLGLGLSSCRKDIDSSKPNETLSKDKLISLNDAIQMEKEKMNIAKYSWDKSQYTGLQKLATTSITPTNATNCPSYPEIINFRENNAIYNNAKDSLHGSGLALRYKFKKGKTYIIKFWHSKVNSYNMDDGLPAIQTFPKLQVGLANDSNFPTTCSNFVNQSSLNIPYSNVPDVAGQNRNTKSNAGFTVNSSSRTITLLADECYDYLWFNVLPVAGSYHVDMGISYLEITELAQSFSFSKSGDFNDPNGSTFKVVYNGFIVDHPFEWTTTGNLIISGSNVGNSVQVKVVDQGIPNGKVMASIPGCGLFSEQTFEPCKNSTSINGPSSMIYNSSVTLNGSYDPNYTYSWEVNGLPTGSTVSSLTAQSLTIQLPQKSINDPDTGYFTAYLTITGPCGQSLPVAHIVNYSRFAGGGDGDTGPE